MTQRDEGGENMLILGFDAGCGTCAEIARRVEQRLGDTLAVRNLSDPEVTVWREVALGPDAPWAPTLFEVNGETVRAWIGKGMALPLSRKLGLSKTWQLMQALGEMPSSGIQTIEKPGVSMSRGKFLKGVGGAAVAMSVLSGAGPLASVAQGAAKNPYDVIRTRKLSGSELSSTARRVGSGADVKNLVGQRLATPEKIATANPTATINSLRNGSAMRVVTYQTAGTRTLTFVEFTMPPKSRAATRAFLAASSDSSTVIVKASEGGLLWRRQSSTGTRSVNSSQGFTECPPVSSKPQGCWVLKSVCCEWSNSSNCRGGMIQTASGCGSCGLAIAAAVGSLGLLTAAAFTFTCGNCAGGLVRVQDCCLRRTEAWVPCGSQG